MMFSARRPRRSAVAMMMRRFAWVGMKASISVFKFAVRKQTELLREASGTKRPQRAPISTPSSPTRRTAAIIMATADRLGLRAENIIVNIDRYGNTTAGTIPLAMDTARQEGKLKKGSLCCSPQ